jgi:hypothetical protein
MFAAARQLHWENVWKIELYNTKLPRTVHLQNVVCSYDVMEKVSSTWWRCSLLIFTAVRHLGLLRLHVHGCHHSRTEGYFEVCILRIVLTDRIESSGRWMKTGRQLHYRGDGETMAVLALRVLQELRFADVRPCMSSLAYGCRHFRWASYPRLHAVTSWLHTTYSTFTDLTT